MNNIYNIDTSKALTAGRCKISEEITLLSHYHKQVEFVYVVDGSISFTANNNVYTLEKDNFAVIKSLDIHSFSILREKTRIFLLILPDVFSINLSDINISTKVFTEENSDIRNFINMFSDFKKISRKYMVLFYQMFYEAIKDLYISENKKEETAENRIISYINHNFKNQLTLNSVAIACNSNRSYVSRAINELYSISFTQYINRLRISSFLDIYLKNPEGQSIEDIALSVGFTNIRTFYRSFRKELNCTPSEYTALEFNADYEKKD